MRAVGSLRPVDGSGGGGGGGGGVMSVNGDPGPAVVLGAADVGADPAGTATDAVAAHVAAPDPHPQYTTEAEAAAAAPVQSVFGRVDDVVAEPGDYTAAEVTNALDKTGDTWAGPGNLAMDGKNIVTVGDLAATGTISAPDFTGDLAGNVNGVALTDAGSGDSRLADDGTYKGANVFGETVLLLTDNNPTIITGLGQIIILNQTTPALPAGEYRIQWSVEASASSGVGRYSSRLSLDSGSDAPSSGGGLVVVSTQSSAQAGTSGAPITVTGTLERHVVVNQPTVQVVIEANEFASGTWTNRITKVEFIRLS